MAQLQGPAMTRWPGDLATFWPPNRGWRSQLTPQLQVPSMEEFDTLRDRWGDGQMDRWLISFSFFFRCEFKQLDLNLNRLPWKNHVSFVILVVLPMSVELMKDVYHERNVYISTSINRRVACQERREWRQSEHVVLKGSKTTLRIFLQRGLFLPHTFDASSLPSGKVT